MGKVTSNYVSWLSKCQDGVHAWWYYGDPIPDNFEGMSCQCGEMIAHYEVCPTCGHEVMQEVPKDEYQELRGEPRMVWSKETLRYIEEV
jgi:hypothetical protein